MFVVVCFCVYVLSDPLQITETTAQFLLRDGGFNLSRREAPPELIANMRTYWLMGMKGSCDTMLEAAGAGDMQQTQEEEVNQLEGVENQQGIYHLLQTN